jgi:hypothetical protein
LYGGQAELFCGIDPTTHIIYRIVEAKYSNLTRAIAANQWHICNEVYHCEEEC